MSENCPKKLSPLPQSNEGLKIFPLGKCSSNWFSPSALLLEYLLSELVFQISDETNINKKYEEIRNEIEQNGFENAATIYSISDTSTSGGKIGWIKENSLNDKIKKVVMETKIGSYTKPMRLPSGFLILFVKNIKEINENLEINIENEIAQNIEIATEQQLNDFSNIYYNKIKKDFSISEI